MKRSVIIAAFVLAAGSIMAADPKGELSAAAKKLADGGNYSWKETTENAGGGGGGGGGGRGGFGGGPVDGQTQKDGLIHTSRTFNDNTTETLRMGINSATKGMDGTWRTAAEAAAAFAANADQNGGGGGRRGRGGFGGFATPAPAATITDVVGKLKDVSLSGGAYVGELTEAGAKSLAMPNFGGGARRGGGGGGGGGGFTPPEVTDAKGSAKFWVTDGVVTKYELKVQGKMSFNGNDIDINRTTTVEIKDVGTTKINAPADVVKKIS